MTAWSASESWIVITPLRRKGMRPQLSADREEPEGPSDSPRDRLKRWLGYTHVEPLLTRTI